MTTKNYSHVRYVLILCTLFSLAILAACKPKPSASQPFPDLKEWDLLIISDSSNFGVGQYYAKLIEADMNVKVNLHDCYVGDMSIGSALQALQSGKSLFPSMGNVSCQTPWSEDAWIDLIKDAEVMVLYGGPQGSRPPEGYWNDPANFLSCRYGGYEGKSKLPGFDTYIDKIRDSCASETLTTYKAHLGAFIDEIYKLREGRPLILRMTDLYNPLHSIWKANDVDDVCTACFRNVTDALRQVAEEHGVPLADTMVGFGGKDYMSDPVEAGYIGPDGEHLSDAGAQFVATLLQQTGYAYSGK